AAQRRRLGLEHVERDLPMRDEPLAVFAQEAINITADSSNLQRLACTCRHGREGVLDIFDGLEPLVADVIAFHEGLAIALPVECDVADRMERLFDILVTLHQIIDEIIDIAAELAV